MKANKNDLHESGRVLTQEEFIFNVKTDDEFAKQWGDLGPIYGKQWRDWRGVEFDDEFRQVPDSVHTHFDQIKNLIKDLKTNPDSRRLMVNAWNVGKIDQMVLPPCHYGFQVYTRELTWEERTKHLDVTNGPWNTIGQISVEMDKQNIPRRSISLMWNQRSVDTFLGLPFNIASYGLLLEILAKEVNMIPDELIGNLGDTHLYLNHIEQAKEQIGIDLTLDERFNFWFNNMKPNRDVVDGFDKLDEFWKHEYLTSAQVPIKSRYPFPLPKLKINTEFWRTETEECGIGLLDTNLKGFEIDDFTLENYKSHPSIKAKLSN